MIKEIIKQLIIYLRLISIKVNSTSYCHIHIVNYEIFNSREDLLNKFRSRDSQDPALILKIK